MRLKKDLIKKSSIAIGLTLGIIFLGVYLIPSIVYITPGYPVHTIGVVDHKKIGHNYDSGGQLQTWYTMSVRLMEEDPINEIQSGETFAYIVSKADWEMVEWGDTVKIRILKDLKAKIVELNPTLKPAEWRELSGVRTEITSAKLKYDSGELATFHIRIWNARNNKTGLNVSIKLTLFQTFSFWIFKEGKNVLSHSDTWETKEVILQPGQEISQIFESDFFSLTDLNVTEGLFYFRMYFGYLTEDPEHPLLATTLVEINA